jgi:hypothetical protein
MGKSPVMLDATVLRSAGQFQRRMGQVQQVIASAAPMTLARLTINEQRQRLIQLSREWKKARLRNGKLRAVRHHLATGPDHDPADSNRKRCRLDAGIDPAPGWHVPGHL